MLIIGGTGSIGQALVKEFEKRGEIDITVLSRDENKQNLMRRKYPQVEYILGDIRDYDSIRKAIKEHNKIYLLAAMKHVRTGEVQPIESVKTNIIGVENVILSCQENQHLIYLSTDKAVEPTSIYGATKMIAESMVKNYPNRSIIRSGNLFSSNGSAIPWFIQLRNQGRKAGLTHPEMARYFISKKRLAKILADVNYIHYDVIVPRMKEHKIVDILNYLECDFEITGKRKGEKLREKLFWEDEEVKRV